MSRDSYRLDAHSHFVLAVPGASDTGLAPRNEDFEDDVAIEGAKVSGSASHVLGSQHPRMRLCLWRRIESQSINRVPVRCGIQCQDAGQGRERERERGNTGQRFG